MSDINNYSFSGRLGAPAETKHTPSGTAIWTARVANSYGYGDNKGTNWVTVKALGKSAERLASLNLDKGAQIGGSGELQVREFDRKDGTKGTAVEVLVNGIALLGSKPEGNTSSGGSRGGAPQRERPAKATESQDFADSDIPFVTNRSMF